MKCELCFYLDNKLGVARPRPFPLNLNTAVDHLLKKEFDIHRKAETTHPLMKKYGIDAVPYQHEDMDTWRENFKGIQFVHKPTGMTISGAIDDIWVNKAHELIIVDYKSTSKDEEVNLDAEWQDGYKRQMEIYQWLFRQNGFKVADTGYFVYANGQKDRRAFDGKLEFDVSIIPYKGSDKWVEEKIFEAKKCLDSNALPKPDSECDYCAYRRMSRDVQETFLKKAKVVKLPTEEIKAKKSLKKINDSKNQTSSLF